MIIMPKNIIYKKENIIAALSAVAIIIQFFAQHFDDKHSEAVEKQLKSAAEITMINTAIAANSIRANYKSFIYVTECRQQIRDNAKCGQLETDINNLNKATSEEDAKIASSTEKGNASNTNFQISKKYLTYVDFANILFLIINSSIIFLSLRKAKDSSKKHL